MFSSLASSLMDFFGGGKLSQSEIPLRQGNLRVLLKERKGEPYLYMRFSYPGNVQYHAIHKENIDEVIHHLETCRDQMIPMK